MAAKNKKKIIWITWENQRRTNELSKALGVELFKMLCAKKYFFRIIKNSFLTIRLILSVRPDKIIVQNPSMVLTALVCFLKDFLNFKVIVDRHSNFEFHTLTSKSIKEIVYHFLSKYTIRKADLTIVTNDYLKEVVCEWGGNGFVLQDKIPDLNFKDSISLSGDYNIVFPCSYDHDEPIKEVIESSRQLPKNIVIYMTGNYKKIHPKIVKSSPSNVIFTGFLNEKEFQSLINSSDLLLALTNQDDTLLCSAYEGVSLQKPLILSRKQSLKEYFYKGVILTDNSPEDISKAIIMAIKDYRNLKSQIKELLHELNNDWQIRFQDLQGIMNKL